MSGYYKHETANIATTAKIGKGTKIWVNSQIRENALIGENCIISKDTYIDVGVAIGNHCKIQNGVSIYQGVIIKNNVFVGPNVTFTNDKLPRAFNEKWKISKTKVNEGASIGANATIMCGISIGKYAMVGAGSVVLKDVADYSLVVGNPATHIGYVCQCGQRLHSNKCQSCDEYLDLF
jgi:UDP-2-acetamido-3-amino-2,3-dideoxy-glucuronate N-acetyltransferase